MYVVNIQNSTKLYSQNTRLDLRASINREPKIYKLVSLFVIFKNRPNA